MKPLHVGLLVVGAAIAGGLAVRMSQPPPSPVSASRLAAPTPVMQPQPALTVAATVPLNPEPAITSAPPPVYAEPKRKPFAEAVRVAARPAPVTIASVAPMPINPAPYQSVPAPAPTPERIAPEPVTEAARPQPAPELRQVTLHQGLQIAVRLNQSLSTEHLANGDSFQASLAEPLVADGLVVAERGARVTGRVVNAQKAGRFTGTSQIELALSTVQTSDGQRVALSTEPWAKHGDSSRNAGAAKIGGGAVLGAIIGAIVGGGPGAAVGAGAGGAAGAGAAAATGGKALDIPNETVIRFRLASHVTITERPL
jgi:hypothetical protein